MIMYKENTCFILYIITLKSDSQTYTVTVATNYYTPNLIFFYVIIVLQS